MQPPLKDGTRYAKRSFDVLGFIYVIFAVSTLVPSLALLDLLLFPLKASLVGLWSASSEGMMPYALLLTGIVLLVAGYLLSKRKIAGVYLGWLFVLVGAIVLFSNNIALNALPLLILTYIAYVNYRAHKTLRSEQSVAGV